VPIVSTYDVPMCSRPSNEYGKIGGWPVSSVQTVDVIWARRASEALKAVGVQAADIVKRAGIRPHLLNQEAARIPFRQHAKLLHLAAQVTGRESFGLELAAMGIDPRDGGLPVYAALSTKTFGESMKVAQRYFHVLNEGADIDIKMSSEAATLECDFIGSRELGLRQAIEFGIANLVQAARFLTGVRLRPTEVTFIHPRKHELAMFERFFGCPVRFGALVNSVVFSRRQCALPIATADPRLLRILASYGDEILAARGDKSPDLRQRVEKIIMKLLPRGEAETQTVAQELGMSARTLARRLSEASVTFAEILDGLRHDLAVSYLREGSLVLSQIAFLLGYSELSGFIHAFRRWTGTTPGEWRTKHQT
jgi:AraC-like DNA-binding protein